jgi:hypothetical protein
LLTVLEWIWEIENAPNGGRTNPPGAPAGSLKNIATARHSEERIMFSRTKQTQQQKPRRIGPVLAALALLSLLSGCVVYVPGGGGPHYHYWR